MTVECPGRIGGGSAVVTAGRQRMKPTRFAGPWVSSPRSLSSLVSPSRSQSSGSFLSQDDVRAGPEAFSSSLPAPHKASNPSSSKHSLRSHKSPTLVHPAQAEMELLNSYRSDILDKKNRAMSKVHILPHLKKTTRDRTPSLDLNLTAVENEGLGIYTNLDRDGDPYVAAARLAGSMNHHRSISGNSQYSATMTMGAGNRPGSHYVHPMKQTPRPYTPPNRSHQNSITGSVSDTTRFPDLDEHAVSASREPSNYPSSSIKSNMEPRQSFNVQHDHHTYPQSSQTRVARTSSSFSQPVDNSSATISPISRSSLEFPFRSKSRPSTTDPVARAAAVQAARQAFEDREAAKLRKHEERTLKAQDKEDRRREHRQQQHQGSVRAPRLSDLTFRNGRHSEKSSHRTVSGQDQSAYYDGGGDEQGPEFKLKTPKSAWLLFLTWLRTRIFKMGKKIKKMG